MKYKDYYIELINKANCKYDSIDKKAYELYWVNEVKGQVQYGYIPFDFFIVSKEDKNATPYKYYKKANELRSKKLKKIHEKILISRY